jgi:DNA-binding transcriptional LysR family regulator
MLDLVRLQTLAAVVEHGSFSAAAQALHITQPAVSRQVALLERQLGAPLLVRRRGGVEPTPAGRVLLGHVTAAADRLTLAEAQVRAMVAQRSGTVRLGSFFSALVHLSAEVAAEVGEHHPDLRFVDDLVDRDTAYAKLGRGELDLAVIFTHDFAPAPVPDGIELHPLFDDPVRILLPAGHRLAEGSAADPADLADETWIQAHDGSAADLTDQVLARHRLDPPRLLAGHGDEPVETQALVATGRGVTLTHDLTVIVNRHQLVPRPLAGETGVRHIAAAYPTGPMTPAAETVLQALRAIGTRRRSRRSVVDRMEG